MSVPYLKEAIVAGDDRKLIRFVRLHLGDGNEGVGRDEIDKGWIEAIKILVNYDPIDQKAIDRLLELDASTLASLYFQLHFHLVKRSDRWIHDGSR